MNDKLLSPKINHKIKQYELKKKRYKLIQQAPICLRCIFFLFPFLQKQPINQKHAIFLNSPKTNRLSFPNKDTNTKYNFLTFIPFVLLNQFRFFGNQFYLLMSLSQFINVLKVGFLFSYLAPLLIVLTTTLIKELIDEIHRYLQDRVTNNEMFTKIQFEQRTKTVKKINIKAKDISVGDVLQLKTNQRIPADMIILQSCNKENKDAPIYLRTDQLDGETDWKLRKAPSSFSNASFSELFKLDSLIEYESSNKNIYDFKGVVFYHDINRDEIVKESLGYENTVWANCVLASSEIYAVVIYTGRETKAKMNANKAKYKVGAIDHEINSYNKILFVFMILLSSTVCAFKESSIGFKIILFFRFIVLFCGIIPISLRVNLDLSKAFFAYQINKDNHIKDTIVRNSTIPEELGRVSYIFTDKTGTLTKNEMIFRKFKTINQTYVDSESSTLKGWKKEDSIDERVYAIDLSVSKVKECIMAMVLCNNVTPIKEDKDKIVYQSSSPDEISLVEFTKRYRMEMINRNDKVIEIQTPKKEKLHYEILAMFPFSSETKRMGIILKDPSTNEITFYLKGAENVIVKTIEDEEVKKCILDKSNQLAKEGLRTLVLTKKTLTQNEYDKWRNEYDNACASLGNREQEKLKAISKLECDMDFLCVTGVEDLLQDKIIITIESLRSAGIKIWMLTGDKSETAKCISISTGIKPDDKKFYEILNDPSLKNTTDMIKSITKQLNSFKKLQSKHDDYILLLEGPVIDICLHNLSSLFCSAASLSSSVICCRCSPTQKSQIVRTMKQYTQMRTLSIGDGGNDVAMIQEADVGIGIVGKEGLQASLQSDFSIIKFCHIKNLLLWWGRVGYNNTSTMANFVIHRGLIISFIQCIFTILFYFNAVALYNGMLILGYGTIYTNLPAMAILLDYDTEIAHVLKFPFLYRELQKGRALSFKAFLSWMWKSIFQASVIMIASVMVFEENIYLKIITVTFTELIFAEILNVYSSINKYNPYIYGILFLSLCSYIASIVLFKSILDVYFIFDLDTMLKVMGIALASWLPIYLFNAIKKYCYPSDIDKLEMLDRNKNKVTL